MEHLFGLASECRLDKQEVQDIALHCALQNGADFYVNEHQKIRHYRAMSTKERRRNKKKKNKKNAK